MVVIDTDILMLAFAFQNDPRQVDNALFLTQVRSAQPTITVYNLMEILGKLSFNLAPRRLDAWKTWLIDAYQLVVIWPIDPEISEDGFSFKDEIFTRPFARMRTHRIPFMDALILDLAERTPGVDQFVTWNARHFEMKSSLKVLTPTEYLK